MRNHVARDIPEQNVLNHIRDIGWSIMQVFDPKNELPNFSYSIGLYDSFQSPEIIVFGLPNDVAKQVINDIGTKIKEGYKMQLHHPTDAFFQEPGTSDFIEMEKTHYKEHLGFDIWYYGGADFPTYQLVWSDKNGKLPWEEGFDTSFNKFQPLLGPTK